MHADVIDAFKSGIGTGWHAVEIVYPGFTLRLCDGGQIEINGDDYLSEDDDYGSLGEVSTISDGETGEAKTVSITLKPPTEAALLALTDPAAQLSRVTIWFGAVDRETGLIVGDPDGVLVGYLNSDTIRLGDAREVDLEVVTADDYALEGQEGQNLSPAFLRSIDPTAAGLDHVTGVRQRDYWGGAPPSSGIRSGGGGGGRNGSQREQF
ncbi:hypothetical protein Q0812_13415 [Brevundimonas sp. 2R-24]|uniref:Uncharacterized protein n=1 Tax=Peiella sedimenti TaxID=3061083 RepID=A0ABT8SPF5_9CAUL|nr:hypothetical protein [Caulobacteraceae bacterium XZ-24]